MALLHSFEKSGNFLFRKRGQLPVVLFLLAVPALYFHEKTCWSAALILTTASIGLSVLGLLVRAIAIGTTPIGTSGRNTREQVANSLNQSGIYSLVRHPLYLGNYFMWSGIVLFTFNPYFFIIVSLAFWLYYERIMFAEERFLERQFGQDYLDWSLTVPAFIPSFRKYIRGTIPFSIKNVLKREYSGIGATVLGFMFVDLVRHFIETGTFSWQRNSVYAFAASLTLIFILRTIKHKTTWLQEEGRS